MRHNSHYIYTYADITQLDTQSDEGFTWDKIYAGIDAILSEEKLRLRHLNLPTERRDIGKRTRESVEILPNGSRRIKMNWNYED